MVDEEFRAPVSRPITLDELIALNDEIAALTRSGMPLERGLIGMEADLPGRLKTITQAIGNHMTAGKSLSDALKTANIGIPPVYEAVVEAGLRSGRLSVALEGMAAYAKALTEARRSVGLALWYPLLLLVISYALFVLLVTRLIPVFVETFAGLDLPIHFGVKALADLGSTAPYWGPLLPIALVVFFIGWSVSKRATSLGSSGRFSAFRWIPWMNDMMAGFEAAGFADLLALLVEHDVPLHDAMTLAGRASGDPAIEKASASAATALMAGQPLSSLREGAGVFPPLLRWLLSSGQPRQEMVVALRQMAERYRSSARYQAEKLRVVLPTLLLFGIGASSALLYSLALFVPLASLWTSLSNQTP